MPTLFTGQLKSNAIFSGIYNMIISQQVFADNVKGTYGALVNHFKVDGTLMGDTKLFYASDILKSYNWNKDSEAANLLSIERPASPKCQEIVISEYRQVRITVDNYLSKQAWSSKDAFDSFNSVILDWIRETKRVYESTLFNAFVGTTIAAGAKQSIDVEIAAAVGTTTGEEKNRLQGACIAEAIANLLTDLKDVSRDYNDYGFLRSYEDSDLMFIFNSAWVNKILKIDLPTIFHSEELKNKLTENVLPARYFGTPITASNIASYEASTPTTGKPLTTSGVYTPGTNHANGCVRSLVEQDFTVSGVTTHCFAGDELPAGATVTGTNNTYIVDADVICKVVHKNSIPFMSAFETATDFFNPRSLTETHYLTWGYSKLDYLSNYPFITLNAD